MKRLLLLVAAAFALAGCAGLDAGQAQEAFDGLSDAMKELEDFSEEFEEAMEEAEREAEQAEKDREQAEREGLAANRDSPDRPEPPLDKDPYAEEMDDIARPEYPNREQYEYDLIEDGVSYEDVVDHYREQYGEDVEPTQQDGGDAGEEVTIFETEDSRVAVVKENDLDTVVVQWFGNGD